MKYKKISSDLKKNLLISYINLQFYEYLLRVPKPLQVDTYYYIRKNNMQVQYEHLPFRSPLLTSLMGKTI